MRILLTNDDGIEAEGLASLERIALELSDDVWTCAPAVEQSGKGRGITLTEPLRVHKHGDRRFSVTGTPTDCVILAVNDLMPARPDLVLSGVNRGQNVAEDVTYSGTIAAAMEGTILGIPSIALSQAFPYGNREGINWPCAEAHGAGVIRQLLEAGIPRGIVINVNFPPRDPADVAGIAVCVQGQRNQALLDVDKRHDGRGNPYYWLAFARGRVEPAEGTDLHALADGKIAITPLRLDLTDLPNLTRLAEHFDRA